MLNRMMTVGNRWTKGNMDRIYVNNETMTQLLDTEASNGVEIRNHFNRRERQNLKMFYDIINDDVVVNTGDESAKQELINALMAMVIPEEVETTEEAETTETTETPKFEEGKSYVATRMCLKYRVVKRTAKMVTLEDVEGGEIVRRKIRTDEIGEYVLPLGNYSMAPVLRAKKETPTMMTIEEEKGNEAESLETEFDDLLDLDGKTHMVDGEELTTSQLAKKYYPDNYRESYQRWLESRQQKTA